MPKQYRIKLLIDASQARSAAKASAADAMALDRAWLKAANAMEGAFAKAGAAAKGVAAAVVDGYARANGAATASSTTRVAAEDRVAKAAVAGVNRRMSAADRATARAVGDHAKAARADERRAAWADREQAKILKDEERKGAARERAAARAEKADQKAAVAADRAMTKGMVGLGKLQMEAVKFGDKLREAAEKGGEGIGDADKAGQSFGDTLRSLAVGSTILMGIRSVADGVTGAIRSAVDEQQNQLDKLLSTKEAIREIVFMTKGFGGVTEPDLRKHMDLRAATGLTADEAKSFRTEFHGAAEAARDVKMPSAEMDRAEVMIGKFAATLGGGEEGTGARGRLAGLLAGMTRHDKAEDLLADTMDFERILSAGVGEDPVLIRQASKVAGSMLEDDETKGHVKKPGHLAAMVATASRVSPTRAADLLKSTDRVLHGHTKKWGGLLRDAKVEEGDSSAEAMDKLFGEMDKAAAAGRDPMSFLTGRGVDSHGAESITAMYKYRTMFGKLMADADDPAKRLTGARAVGEVEKAFGEDRSLEIKRAEAAKERAEMDAAKPLEAGRLFKTKAETRLAARGEGTSSPGAKVEDVAHGKLATGFGWAPTGYTDEQIGRMIRVEEEQYAMAREAGVDVPGRPEESSPLGGYSARYLSWLITGGPDAAYAAVQEEIELRKKTGVKGKRVPSPPPRHSAREDIRKFFGVGKGDFVPGPPTPAPAAAPIPGPAPPAPGPAAWGPTPGVGAPPFAVAMGGVEGILNKIHLALTGGGRFSPAEMPGSPPSLPGGPRAGSIRPGGMTA